MVQQQAHRPFCHFKVLVDTTRSHLFLCKLQIEANEIDTIAELKLRDIELEEAGNGAGWSPIRSAIVILIVNDYFVYSFNPH